MRREYRVRGTVTLEVPRSVSGEDMTPQDAEDQAVLEAIQNGEEIARDVRVEEL